MLAEKFVDITPVPVPFPSYSLTVNIARTSKPILILLLLVPRILAAQSPTKAPSSGQSRSTLFIDCNFNEKPKQIFSPVSISEDRRWLARVEVNVRGDLGCMYTTRLWVAGANQPYRLVYLIPPNRSAQASGMAILGWAPKSRLLLVRSNEWQTASDALIAERVFAIDAKSGMVYEPRLEEMLSDRKNKERCLYRVTEAGFHAGGNVEILIRAKFSTYYREGDTEEDVPAGNRCENSEETWSFSFATGAIQQVPDSEPLLLFKKHVLSRESKLREQP